MNKDGSDNLRKLLADFVNDSSKVQDHVRTTLEALKSPLIKVASRKHCGHRSVRFTIAEEGTRGCSHKIYSILHGLCTR